MNKKHLALILAATPLFIASCQNIASIKNNNVGDSLTTVSEPQPPTPDSTFVEIDCEGCKVKQTDAGSDPAAKQIYKNYVMDDQLIHFAFLTDGDGLDYPSLQVSLMIGDKPVAGNPDDYEYDDTKGELTFSTNFDKYNFVKISAFTATPAFELDFAGAEKTYVSANISYQGTLKAVDFNGTIVSGSEFSEGTINNSEIPVTGGGVGSLKIYGNIYSITINSEFSDIAQYASELYLNNVASIDYMSFITMYNLKKMHVGPSLKKIVAPESNIIYEYTAKNPNFGMQHLDEIEVSEDNPYLDSRDDCNCIIDSKTNTLLVGGANGRIPDGVTSIGSCAYFCNQDLTYVILPDSVRSIDPYAFSYSSISYVSLSANLTGVASFSFSNCPFLSLVDFSNLDHAPAMKCNAFGEYNKDTDEDSRSYITSSQILQNTATFIHNNYSIMGSKIFMSLANFDTSWGDYKNQFSVRCESTPALVYISELDPTYNNDEITSVFLTSSQYEDYGTHHNVCLDPFNSNPGLTFDIVWDSNKFMYEYAAKYSDPKPSDFKTPIKEFQNRRSSYCVAIYASHNDREKGTGERLPAYLSANFNLDGTPLGRNAEDIAMVKWFGNYFEDGTIVQQSYKDLNALRDVIFSKRYTLTYGDGQFEMPVGELMAILPETFSGTSIESITLPSSLREICNRAFAECVNLKEIKYDIDRDDPTIPLMLTGSVFAGDIALESTYIPSFVVTQPESNPFMGCSSLASITCESGNIGGLEIDKYGTLSIGEMGICPINSFNPAISYQEGTYKRVSCGFYSVLKSPVIKVTPDRIARFDQYAFAYSNAKKIIFESANGAELMDYMFAYCPNLEVVDLSKCGEVIPTSGINVETLFKNTYTDYKLLIKSDQYDYYHDYIGIDSSHIQTVE